MAATKSRRMPDRAVKVFAGAFNRVSIAEPVREIGGDGGRERAAGSMGMRCDDPRTTEFEPAVARACDINRIGTLEVPSLYEYDAWSGSEDPFSRRPHVVERADGHLGKNLCFGDVRRHDMRNLQQLGFHRRNRIHVEQSIAPFCDHDRIDDHLWQIECTHRRGNGFDDRRVR